MSTLVVSRFAPSPTGFLHLGHAYSAVLAHRLARRAGGRFLLRLEDIDPVRCKPAFGPAILEDLAWLGLDWDGPVRVQSAHLDTYRAALNRLDGLGLLYPCFCTRAAIAAEGAAIAQAPHGPDGPLYPGTCRVLSPAERARRRAAGEPFALRLDMTAAVARVGPLTWHDALAGTVSADPSCFGDVVLARKDVPASYHLAVSVDDALQEVSLVTRGQDLFQATHIHRLLQALLDLPTPAYHHHPLVCGPDGRRYAKRDRSVTLRALREAGVSPAEVRARLEGGDETARCGVWHEGPGRVILPPAGGGRLDKGAWA
ncbi:tRNA glutamyl-Q(34) synthetase GluQRS [Pararhodospirillum oryzae]|uniref:tRNA glutamyl-Q(34) synthetase GluQRS n=1 Tax=Pararhodospirillum oryzae TaxID=478448 RepID=A0A512H6A1_9PROT|nr:tRNA glutamyl-Q(34) synthetase GluQRS [Pararhodospirillum oryzae]GEO80995.1 tRNA glutamyl-Q(34) synthetase GluQRS [Pararhodospirillum oryzae]